VCGKLQGTFFEAVCQEIDPVQKTIKACIPSDPEDSCFKVPYDILVLGAYFLSLSPFVVSKQP
jgi:hypothetical protein